MNIVSLKRINQQAIEDFLICPQCSQILEKREEEFVCTTCSSTFPFLNEIPYLVRTNNKHKHDEADYHNSISKKYQQLHQLNSLRNIYYHRMSLLPIIKRSKDGLVLELGCGTGYDALFLLQNNQRVIETDISPGQVSTAKRILSLTKYRNRVLFYISDAENIPFSDALFDATFIMASLHHLEKPEKALLEMKRCTKPGGTIIIAMEPNRYEWIGILGFLFSIIKNVSYFLLRKHRFDTALERADEFREPTGEKTFSKGDIVSLIKETGLHLTHMKGIWFTCGLLHWSIILLNKLSKNRWYLNKDIERIFIGIDEFLSHIPLVNYFACNWSVDCRK